MDWTAALTPGAIDVFVKSVRKTVYESGGISSMYRLLQAIFGPYLASEHVGDPSCALCNISEIRLRSD